MSFAVMTVICSYSKVLILQLTLSSTQPILQHKVHSIQVCVMSTSDALCLQTERALYAVGGSADSLLHGQTTAQPNIAFGSKR